ncbi:MAG: transposase [Beijerinckiaceae bacterium]
MNIGTLVDATIIEAAVKPPPHAGGQVNASGPDASFTVKKDQTYFGYKAHLAVDEDSGGVRQAEMTSADLHDSQRGEAMIQGDEEAYYAGKAAPRPCRANPGGVSSNSRHRHPATVSYVLNPHSPLPPCRPVAT